MSYNVRLYINSGFNLYNIPDSPALLNQCNFVDVPAIDTLQDRFLTSIRVHTTWAAVKDADYCKVSDGIATFFYAIDDIRMLSGDTAMISLIPDFLLSAGGPAALTYTDGITERVHVALADDEYGKYTEDDPLTAPSMSMQLATKYVDDPPGNGIAFLVESSINLSNESTPAKTYTDEDTGDTVTVPQAPKLNGFTYIDFSGERATGIFPMVTPQQKSQIQGGIRRARDLGIEDAIVASYAVPDGYIAEDLSLVVGEAANLTGIRRETVIQELPYEHAQVQNRRCLYGEYEKYGILTTAGNSGEFRAEQIYHSGDSTPSIFCIPDVRSEGKPYYRFRYFMGEDGTADGQKTFWKNCLAGSPWSIVPIVYNAKSGGALDRLQFSAERKADRQSFEADMQQRYNDLIASGMGSIGQGLIGGAITGAKGGVGGALVGGLIGTVTGGAGALSETLRYGDQLDREKARFASRRTAEWTRYLVGQVSSPQITFPYDAHIVRDALGNGVFVYRYIYQPEDIARIDRLLTMYGYRYTKFLATTDFNNRAKFNYVQAQGVSVTGLPKWFADGVAEQLMGGVRVWHVLPDVSTYTDGSNT